MRTISSGFFLSIMTIGACAGQCVQGTQIEKIDGLACVGVLELPLRNVRGSKARVNGTGCSWRKYSSGV